MAKRDELLRLNDFTDRKGFGVATAMVPHHVRLIDPEGRL